MKNYIIVYNDNSTDTVSGKNLYSIVHGMIEEMDLSYADGKIREFCLRGIDADYNQDGNEENEIKNAQNLVYIYNYLSPCDKYINEIYEINKCVYDRFEG